MEESINQAIEILKSVRDKLSPIAWRNRVICTAVRLYLANPSYYHITCNYYRKKLLIIMVLTLVIKLVDIPDLIITQKPI